MQVISFCLNGKMAHFRKYYSNSTALSYFIPPLTTVKGIIAGLLGYERDSYYDLFSNARCRIAIINKRPIKKITQTLNLLKVESLNDLNGAGKNRTQNDTEFIVPRNLREDFISFQIIFWHENVEIMQQLIKNLCTNSVYYCSDAIALALGSLQCPGWISEAEVHEVEMKRSHGTELPFHSVVSLDKIEKVVLQDFNNAFLAKEESITEFDAERNITENAKKEVLVNINQSEMTILLKEGTEYFSINDQNILFLE